jgi:hypothetical protein
MAAAVFTLASVLVSGAAAADSPDAPWPGLIGNEAFAKQSWPKARVLTWAKPGEPGDPMKAESWLEDGNPAKAPPDKDTDIVLPDAPAGTKYLVGLMIKRSSRTYSTYDFAVRHVTIGRGAALDLGTNSSKQERGKPWGIAQPKRDNPLDVYGNISVAAGGFLYGPIRFRGGGHTVVRIDDDAAFRYLHTVEVHKEADASVTILARGLRIAAGLRVESGRLVIGPNAEVRYNAGWKEREAWANGGQAAWRSGFKYEGYRGRAWYVRSYDYSANLFRVLVKGALELRTGAALGPAEPFEQNTPDILIEGSLSAGSAARPLTGSARIELTRGEGAPGFLSLPGGLYVREGGTMQVHAGGDGKGGLEILPFGKVVEAKGAGAGISMYLEAPQGLSDVTFEGVRAAGILCPDPKAEVARWQRCTFADTCAGPAEKLFAAMPPKARGGKGTVEFVDGLTTECEIVMEHPNCDRLVVRSLGGGCVQTFDLRQVHAVTIAGKREVHNPKRALTADEKKARQTGVLWGDEVGKGQIGNYGKQAWKPARLLVWAVPGRSGDALVAGNWLEADGRPAIAHPYKDPEVDVLLPPADEKYSAFQPGHRDGNPKYTVRHLTIEGRAGYKVGWTIRGNLWVKDGGNLGANSNLGTFGGGAANRHTFARFEGRRWPGRRIGLKGESKQIGICHWVWIDAGEKGTFEVIGQTGGASDRGGINRGTLIVSEDSHFGVGPRAPFYTRPGTTTILLDGASVGCLYRWLQSSTATYSIDGTMMFGTPEHPLMRDLRVELAVVDEKTVTRHARPGGRTKGGSFVLGESGRLVVHSADPEKARVVFCPRPADAPVAASNVRGGNKTVPKGVAAVFAGETDFNGVMFDGFYKGGIIVDPKARARWRNVSFGPNNLADADELFQDLRAASPGGVAENAK